MFTYNNVKNNPKLFRAMTTLDQAEFEELLPYFQSIWNAYVQETSIPIQKRQRQPGGGRKAILCTTADKLLFILYYNKAYPLQEIFAFEFDLSQQAACSWIHILSEVLKRTLASMGHLPERKPAQVAAGISSSGESVLGIDGTERRRQRPKNAGKQKQYYSGKKKAHTVKNNVIVTFSSRRVKYLSGTYEGKKHDKKICDEEQPTLPEGITLYQDLGFQGYEPAGVNTKQPKKKPRGQELSEEDKQGNRLISKVRIIVEHVLSGIKRCHIVKDVFRNYKAKFDDLVMEIACGLHNFRTACRSRAALLAT